MKAELALAIDIGGTYAKTGVIDSSGAILALQRTDTPAKAEPEIIVQVLLRMIANLEAQSTFSLADVRGVGISIAAFITAAGLVTDTAHLSKNWIGYDLDARLKKDIHTPLYYALDTPAPAIGEAYFGAGKGIKHFVYITVSTGIGAGIVYEGKYQTGGMGWAGGVGHTIIDETSSRVCEGCGNHGCLETFAAKQGILATASELMDQHPESLLHAVASGESERLTPALICEAAIKDDRVAIEVFRRAGHALGIGLTNLVDIVSPQRIVVGGGIAQAGDLLLEPARAVVRQRAFPQILREVEIVQAALGDLSGLYGAAALVFYDLRIN
jgi:glucokinase